MWDALGNFANAHGVATLVFLGALCFMGGAVYLMWKRNGEHIETITTLSRKLASGGGMSDVEAIQRHKEVVDLLKTVRFAYSGDGEVTKKLNEIFVIEEALYEAHLGTGARDEEGRLKWWGASRMEELLNETVLRYEERIAALQELRLTEGQAAGNRIDDLQEKRVAMSTELVRESIEVMKDVHQLAKRIHEVMEDLRTIMLLGRNGQ